MHPLPAPRRSCSAGRDLPQKGGVREDAALHFLPSSHRRHAPHFPVTCHCEPVTDVTGVAIRNTPAPHSQPPRRGGVLPRPPVPHPQPCPRRGRRLPTVVPTDSRPLSWPPIGALPRNRLASSATGGALPISPTPRFTAPLDMPPVGRHPCVPPPTCTAPPTMLP